MTEKARFENIMVKGTKVWNLTKSGTSDEKFKKNRKKWDDSLGAVGAAEEDGEGGLDEGKRCLGMIVCMLVGRWVMDGEWVD